MADGDTVTLLDVDNRQHKIRLGGIDTPERGQPFGRTSKHHLATLLRTHGRVSAAWAAASSPNQAEVQAPAKASRVDRLQTDC